MATNRFAVRRLGALVLALVLAVALGAGAVASCSAGENASAGTDAPRAGGTLRLAGVADVDHLDPAAAASAQGHTLLRLLSRQLVGYRAPIAGEAVGSPVPDLAEALPEPGDDGTVYTFTIRRGAAWNTVPPRQVTAADVVRGFQRLCNPVATGGMPAHVPDLIAGMAGYCAELGRVPADAGAIRRHLEAHPLPGVQALDERTVRFTLTRPASDFLDLLAMPFAAPIPVEALDRLPDSVGFRRGFVSSGPYAITRYDPAHGITLERNPAWQRSTDPLREAYVDRIEVRYGVDERAVQRSLEAGEADLAWDTAVPAADLGRLRAADDRRLTIGAGAGGRYLWLNFASPNENHAMANPQVRQALNYAVDKRGIGRALGDPLLFPPHDQILPARAPGYREFNLYPTPEHGGDPGAARRLLDKAGYPNGLTLSLRYPADTAGMRVAGELKEKLARAGIRLRLDPVADREPAAFYRPSPSLTAVGSGTGADAGPAGVAPGAAPPDRSWDLALTETGPAWPGVSSRTRFGRLVGAPGFPDPEVGRLVESALTAPSAERAAGYWSAADRQAMQAAVCVPLVAVHAARFAADRVQRWTVNEAFPGGDLTAVWLDPEAPTD